MKHQSKPAGFTLSPEGLLSRLALATLLAGASGLAMAQAPASTATPDSIAGTTTQAADAASIPSGTTPSSDAPSNDAGSVNLEKVVVTGSRIRSLNAASSSPVTTVNASELKYQGTTRVEDLLNNLPQVVASQGSSVSNGSDGTANIDLRGLGASRTLTLIDGKRVQPGSPTGTSAVDINFIPGQLIERIDVLTGGASAVYGADAVSGVVNFVLKKNFDGLQVDVQRSGYQHNNDDGGIQDIVRAHNYPTPTGSRFDGQGWDLSGILGVNTDDGRGNITSYVTYRQINQVAEDQRDYSACTLAVSGPNSYACSGSSTSFPGRFTSLDSGASYTLDPATGNTFRKFVSARDTFNFGPYNFFQRNDERYTFGTMGRYKFNDHVESYTQLMYMEDKTDAVIAPSGAFFGGQQYTLDLVNNPLLSTQERQTLAAANVAGGGDGTTANLFIGRRNVEGGGRDNGLTHSSYRLLTGLRGDLPYDFTYDASVQYGTTTLNQVYNNDFSNVRLQRALDVVTGANGTPQCRTFVNGTDPNCVPYNIFALGGVTPAALAYLQVPLLQQGRLEERVATGSVSGIIPGTRLPLANEGIGIVGGLEYREERSATVVDTEFATGDGAGQGGATLPAAGQFSDKDVFTEVRVPLMQRQFGVYDLGLEGGYRYSSYNKFANTNTFKYGINYSPIEALKFRGGFNRAVRTPSVNELATPISVGIDGSTDPCAGMLNDPDPTQRPTATAAQCAHDPYFAANPGKYGNTLNNPAFQYNGQTGTAPGLHAERADTYTAGVVFSPTKYARGLITSVDFYSIRIKGEIGIFGETNILNACYQSNALCNLIHRDNQGTLFSPNGYVIDNTTNTGKVYARGIDINANYRAKLSDMHLGNNGSISIDFVGSRNLRQHNNPFPGTSDFDYDCNGHYGNSCNNPNPNYRQKLRLTYLAPVYGITPSVQWRLFGPVSADAPTVATGVTNNLDNHIGTYNYIDLYISAKPVPAYQNITARIGVNNVTDKRPPVIGSGVAAATFLNGNSFSQSYDVLGRYLFAGVTMNFGGRGR